MKIFKIIFILILLLLFFGLGYLAGNFTLLGKLKLGQGIAGNEELIVKVVTEKNEPISNLEVDIDSELPPSPARLEMATTDEKGVAKFYLKPGVYYILFNLNNFPKHLKYPQGPDLKKTKVYENKINETTIILKEK